MAKKLNNAATQASKDVETARLGCTFDVQTLELINVAALMRNCTTAEILADAIWSLVGTMENKQREAILTVVRAKHGRLKRSCGHTHADTEPTGSEGQGSGEQAINRISQIHQRASLPVDIALESM